MLTLNILGAVTMLASISGVQTTPTSIPTKTATKNTTYDELPFPIQPMSWIGQLERGGPNVTITGSPSQIHAKLKEDNPFWMREGIHANTSSHAHELEKRGRTGYWCMDSSYSRPLFSVAVTEYTSIFNRFGGYLCAADAYSCSRFACEYDTSTLLCNAGGSRVVIPCDTFATNAEFITNQCRSGFDPSVNIYTGGQAYYFNPTYNVLIQHTSPQNDC